MLPTKQAKTIIIINLKLLQIIHVTLKWNNKLIFQQELLIKKQN